jgi:hypothetical protein
MRGVRLKQKDGRPSVANNIDVFGQVRSRDYTNKQLCVILSLSILFHFKNGRML